MKRSLVWLALLAGSLAGQTLTFPPQATNPSGQVSVTTSWLYANKMHYAGTWSATVTYNSQDLAIYAGAPYVSLHTANLANNPASAPTWWVALPGGSGGGGGAVASVFGRTGAVVAQSGDIPNNAANTSGSAGSLSGTINQGYVYAGPASGGSGGASWRALAPTDLPSSFDRVAFVICTTAGCLTEQTFTNYFVLAPNGVTFDECGVSLATMPTNQSVIIDIRTAAGVSIFGATKLVINIADTPGVAKFQSTFASAPYTAAKGAEFFAVVLQGDTDGLAQGGFVQCRVH